MARRSSLTAESTPVSPRKCMSVGVNRRTSDRLTLDLIEGVAGTGVQESRDEQEAFDPAVEGLG